MAHECGCQSHSPATAQAAGAAVTGDLTVGEVAHHYAGALDIIAHLTLREAAASAGVPLEALLDGLNRPAAVKA